MGRVEIVCLFNFVSEEFCVCNFVSEEVTAVAHASSSSPATNFAGLEGAPGPLFFDLSPVFATSEN